MFHDEPGPGPGPGQQSEHGNGNSEEKYQQAVGPVKTRLRKTFTSLLSKAEAQLGTLPVLMDQPPLHDSTIQIADLS